MRPRGDSLDPKTATRLKVREIRRRIYADLRAAGIAHPEVINNLPDKIGALYDWLSDETNEYLIVDEQVIASQAGIAVEPVEQSRIQIIQGFTASVLAKLLQSPDEMLRLSPSRFEELIMDRLGAMHYDVVRVGHANQPDGGIDLIFTTPRGFGLPICGAVQVKHHKHGHLSTGSEVVRNLIGSMEQHRGVFNLGMVVTNTRFTAEAEFAARPFAFHLRLRDGLDVRRWIEGNFFGAPEWRELPSGIHVTSKLHISL